MKKMKYLMSQLLGINLRQLRATIRECAARADRPRTYIVFDMLGCAFKYTAAPADYALFEFYRLNAAQRESYITRGINNAIVKAYNPTENWHLFDNKDEFNALFSEYLKRDWLRADLATQSEFLAFIKKHPVFFYKPRSQSCGEGIKKMRAADHPDKQALFQSLSCGGPAILEQPIEQHQALGELYSGSINTLRLVTIRSERQVDVLFSFLRIGNGGVVDNINAGGMAAPVCLSTGRIIGPGADKNHNVFWAHPKTAEHIPGRLVPLFFEAVKMAKSAALVSNKARYIAWDLAITPNGPCLVEGNCYPGYDILQLPAHLPSGCGMLSRVAPYLAPNAVDLSKARAKQSANRKSEFDWNVFGDVQQ